VGWVGTDSFSRGLGWVGFSKLDPRPCLSEAGCKLRLFYFVLIVSSSSWSLYAYKHSPLEISQLFKRVLLNTYCLCLYDVALWAHYFSKSLDKFRSCYNRCLKLFFGYKRYDSVTSMLSEISLPSFETVLYDFIS